MRAIRWLAASAVATFAAYAVYVLAWRPLVCNTVVNQMQRIVDKIFDLPNGPTLMLTARQGIVEMQRCIAACPTDADMYMTLASYDRIIGRLQHAAEMYGEALKYDRRPELFFNLGEVQLEMNQRQDAIASFTKAASFDIRYSDDIPDPTVRTTVIATVRIQKERGIANAHR